VVTTLALGVTAASGSADRSTVSVNWHPQQASQGHAGLVDNASATLVRNEDGISYRLHTNSLTANNAYTLWLVVVNNPEACDSSPCTAPDIILNGETDSQVLFGTGLVAGGSGKATFAGTLKEGDLAGWLPDRTFDDAGTAEIHLVLNDHGPSIPSGLANATIGTLSAALPEPVFTGTRTSVVLAQAARQKATLEAQRGEKVVDLQDTLGALPSMIKTYRGGCSDESPFPAIFPATALSDGEVGPNICRLFQSAIFTAP